MKLKTIISKTICNLPFASLQLKKATFIAVLFCGFIFNSNGQSHVHDDSTIILEKNSFSVVINHTIEGLLHIELVSNLASEISPLFMETQIKGYILNESHIEQNLNNVIVTSNIERVFGPQFMDLGINSLPAFGNYKTTFETVSKTDEVSTIHIRINGTLNGQPIVWSRAFNF